MKNRKILLSFVPIILMCSFLLGAYFEFNRSVAEKKHDMVLRLALLESRVNSMTTNNIDKMKSVATYVSLNTELDIDELNYVIERALKGSGDLISNIGIFEDTTAIYLYPYETNKEMKDIDLVEIPTQKDDALRVKYKHEVVITPPVEIIQGGKGIMTRLPIVLVDGTYWGQLGYMIKYEKFIEKLELVSDNYSYMIEQIEKDGSSSHKVFDIDFNEGMFSGKTRIDMPSCYWVLSISGSNSLELYSLSFYILFIFAFTSYWYSNRFILELRLANEELDRLSGMDELTGIQNRREIRNTGHFYNSAIFFDIDNFKKINDNFGHYCGDEILIFVTKRVTAIMRGSDTFVRWGGEEFVVILNSDSVDVSVAVAYRIRECIKEPIVFDGVSFDITCSFGVAHSKIGNNIDIQTIIKRADIAMYEAKKNGKDRVEVAEN